MHIDRRSPATHRRLIAVAVCRRAARLERPGSRPGAIARRHVGGAGAPAQQLQRRHRRRAVLLDPDVRPGRHAGRHQHQSRVRARATRSGPRDVVAGAGRQQLHGGHRRVHQLHHPGRSGCLARLCGRSAANRSDDRRDESHHVHERCLGELLRREHAALPIGLCDGDRAPLRVGSHDHEQGRDHHDAMCGRRRRAGGNDGVAPARTRRSPGDAPRGAPRLRP